MLKNTLKLLVAAGAVVSAVKALKPLALRVLQGKGTERLSLGRALLDRSAAFKQRSAYDKGLAKAAAYLCEGTYQGQEEAEKRMRELGFSDAISKYYSSDLEMNASPITVASEVVSSGDEAYLVVAAAVRGTHPRDIGDYLTDIRPGHAFVHALCA